MAADPWALFGSDSDEDQTTAMVSVAAIAARRVTKYSKPIMLVSYFTIHFLNIQPPRRKQVVTADRAMAQALLPVQALVVTKHCLLAEALATVATAFRVRLLSPAVLPVRMFVLGESGFGGEKADSPADPTYVRTWYSC